MWIEESKISCIRYYYLFISIKKSHKSEIDIRLKKKERIRIFFTIKNEYESIFVIKTHND